VQRELEFTARLSPADFAALALPVTPGLPEDEFVVVQGVADLVVLQSAEIWLLDFKTDLVTAKNLPERVRAYRPQIALYALALNRIYQRPVTKAWLHFLTLNQNVALDVAGLA